MSNYRALEDHIVAGLLRQQIEGNREAEMLLAEIARRYDALAQTRDRMGADNPKSVSGLGRPTKP